MPKVNKVYPAFFNGVSQQSPELVLDSQCKEMVNCVPSIVEGLSKRPPVLHKKTVTYALDSLMQTSRVFHVYDRGEDDEEYVMLSTGNYTTPVRVFNKEGTEMSVVYTSASEAKVKTYLANGGLRGLTVQDRTWVYSKKVSVDIDYTDTVPLSITYDKVAYYWLKRGSGDKYNPYNYTVYLDGIAYSVDPLAPATDDTSPPPGAESTDLAAGFLKDRLDGVYGGSAAPGFTTRVLGSVLEIKKTDGSDFSFSTWDSWGNQASIGWKGSTNKITDLPKDMPFTNVFVSITGSESNTFTDYFVKWNGNSWEECRDPLIDRGLLINMPVKMDRTALVNGVATFTFDMIDWTEVDVGNMDNNPDPSFVGYPIQDLFFYKNRLGLASSGSVVLSETANYTNFYATTVLEIVDTDIIDVTIATNKASKIYFAKPFNSSLYIFTKNAQYELVSEGGFTPSNVSLVNSTNYPMAVDVEPVVVNDSLYFISTTDNRQQLREYIKSETLAVKGIDLNISTPTYLEDKVTSLVVDGLLGYILCCTSNNNVYLYNYKEDGSERIQSSWSEWKLLEGLETVENTFEYKYLGTSLLVMCKTLADYRYHYVTLDNKLSTGMVDTSSDGTIYTYESRVKLQDFYPSVQGVKTPMDKVLLKRVTIEGQGSFDAEVYRKDYKTTNKKLSTAGLKDLTFHVSSKVGNVDISVVDKSSDNFNISSIIIEGTYSPRSKGIK